MSHTLNKKNTVPFSGNADSIHYIVNPSEIMGYDRKPVSIEYCGNTRTKKLLVKEGNDAFRSVKPEEFARLWANAIDDKPVPEKPKKDWSFGDWLGVIFTFGQWRPKENKALHDRYRQCCEWNGVSRLKDDNLISDKDYARLQKKYRPVSDLANAMQVDAYIKTGKLPEKGAVGVSGAHDKSFELTKNKIENMCGAFRDNRKNFDDIKNGHMDCVYPLEKMRSMISNKLNSPAESKRAFMTAGYLANLPQEEFDKSCKEYLKAYEKLKGTTELRDQLFSGHDFASILYNLQSCVALIKGKTSLTQLLDEAMKPDSEFVYADVFPKVGTPRLEKMSDAMKNFASKHNVNLGEDIGRRSVLTQ